MYPKKKGNNQDAYDQCNVPDFASCSYLGIRNRLKHETLIENDQCESIVAIPIHEPTDRSFA